jgi:hypothetical protein
MNLENKTTAELEARDSELTKTRQMLCSWANRKLSMKSRTSLIEGIRQEQDAITNELMKRERVGA